MFTSKPNIPFVPGAAPSPTLGTFDYVLNTETATNFDYVMTDSMIHFYKKKRICNITYCYTVCTLPVGGTFELDESGYHQPGSCIEITLVNNTCYSDYGRIWLPGIKCFGWSY